MKRARRIVIAFLFLATVASPVVAQDEPTPAEDAAEALRNTLAELGLEARVEATEDGFVFTLDGGIVVVVGPDGTTVSDASGVRTTFRRLTGGGTYIEERPGGEVDRTERIEIDASRVGREIDLSGAPVSLLPPEDREAFEKYLEIFRTLSAPHRAAMSGQSVVVKPGLVSRTRVLGAVIDRAADGRVVLRYAIEERQIDRGGRIVGSWTRQHLVRRADDGSIHAYQQANGTLHRERFEDDLRRRTYEIGREESGRLLFEKVRVQERVGEGAGSTWRTVESKGIGLAEEDGWGSTLLSGLGIAAGQILSPLSFVVNGAVGSYWQYAPGLVPFADTDAESQARIKVHGVYSRRYNQFVHILNGPPTPDDLLLLYHDALDALTDEEREAFLGSIDHEIQAVRAERLGEFGEMTAVESTDLDRALHLAGTRGLEHMAGAYLDIAAGLALADDPWSTAYQLTGWGVTFLKAVAEGGMFGLASRAVLGLTSSSLIRNVLIGSQMMIFVPPALHSVASDARAAYVARSEEERIAAYNQLGQTLAGLTGFVVGARAALRRAETAEAVESIGNGTRPSIDVEVVRAAWEKTGLEIDPVTLDTLVSARILPEQRCQRVQDGSNLDAARSTVTGNPNPMALVKDFYNPKGMLGALEYLIKEKGMSYEEAMAYARERSPGFRGIEPALREASSLGRPALNIRNGDVMQYAPRSGPWFLLEFTWLELIRAGSRVYPDHGAGLTGCWIVTFLGEVRCRILRRGGEAVEPPPPTLPEAPVGSVDSEDADAGAVPSTLDSGAGSGDSGCPGPEEEAEMEMEMEYGYVPPCLAAYETGGDGPPDPGPAPPPQALKLLMPGDGYAPEELELPEAR